MKRRSFLTTAAAAGALTVMPAWIREAFAFGPYGGYAMPEKERLEVLFEAYRRARWRLKPLLVFIAPEKQNPEAHTRAAALQALVEHGTDRELAPLVTCEVVCATRAHLLKLVPSAQVKAETFAVLIETDQVPAKSTSAQTVLPKGKWSKRDPRADAAVVAKMAIELIKPRAKERGERVLAQWPEVKTKISEGPLSPKDADTYGPFVWHYAQDDALYARAVRARLSDQYIPGSRWNWTSGCGSRLPENVPEEDVVVMIGCGMGGGSHQARRFLTFFAKKHR